MITRTLLDRAKRALRTLLRLKVLLPAALAVILLMASAPRAAAATTTIKDRKYLYTFFDTLSSPVTVSCSTANCTTSGQINFLIADCPNLTCTYYIHLEAETQLSAGDNGRFKFLVGGSAPVPGPTTSDGSVVWSATDPDALTRNSSSYSVVATVPTADLFGVTVEIGCSDIGGGGCSATAFQATLKVDVYTP